MRALIQRVQRAQVRVDDRVTGKIAKGLLVLLAITDSDVEEDINYILDKTLGLRVFEDENNKMNLSLKDVNGEILVVSQFTLYGDVRKGKRPSFTQSAKGDFAEEMYELFLTKVRENGFDVQTGEFGQDMKVELINDGPVTIQLDSSRLY